jgi:hypothetical protein
MSRHIPPDLMERPLGTTEKTFFLLHFMIHPTFTTLDMLPHFPKVHDFASSIVSRINQCKQTKSKASGFFLKVVVLVLELKASHILSCHFTT